MTAETFIKKIAKEAGDIAWSRFGKDGAFYMKSEYAYDVVTKADLAVDTFVVSKIKKAFPSHGICAEESGKVNAGAEYVWYVDPIDGTKNFSKGIPLFGTMIALAHKKHVILSAVYIPMNRELFFAQARRGAFLNNRRIHCSAKRDFMKSEGFAQMQFMSRNIAFTHNLLMLKNIEHLAVATYNCMAVNGCYVAAGRKDWTVAPYGAVHDYAAVSLILKEAGCKVTTLAGAPWTLDNLEMVAANPILHKKLMKLTKNV